MEVMAETHDGLRISQVDAAMYTRIGCAGQNHYWKGYKESVAVHEFIHSPEGLGAKVYMLFKNEEPLGHIVLYSLAGYMQFVQDSSFHLPPALAGLDLCQSLSPVNLLQHLGQRYAASFNNQIEKLARKVWEVYDLVVYPQHRASGAGAGKGYGSLLFDYATKEVVGEGLSVGHIDFSPAELASFALSSKNGGFYDWIGPVYGGEEECVQRIWLPGTRLHKTGQSIPISEFELTDTKGVHAYSSQDAEKLRKAFREGNVLRYNRHTNVFESCNAEFTRIRL